MTDDLEVHPADVLAQQLDRVSGLVRILGELYSPKQESFAAGNSFIAHGLVAVSTILDEAQEALESLHQVCDLRFTSGIATTHTSPPETADSANEEPMIFPPPETQWNQQEEFAAVEQAEVIEPAASQIQPQQSDEFAQSYLELLRKLTAAEVFAAEQQALAPPGSSQNLLPLLRSLREEFQRLHKVA